MFFSAEKFILINYYGWSLFMNYPELLDYCLLKKGAYVDHPFGPDSDIIKVEGKIFAQLFS